VGRRADVPDCGGWWGGVNFHAGEDKIYTPISHGLGGGLIARPLYYDYGMLMFAQAPGDLVPARLDSGGPTLAAYAVRAADGALRLVVINKDARAASARIEPGRRFAKGEVSRLTAPALDATVGVRFGGAAVNDYGGWVPVARESALAGFRGAAGAARPSGCGCRLLNQIPLTSQGLNGLNPNKVTLAWWTRRSMAASVMAWSGNTLLHAPNG
jgi:hypothetical protein